MKQRGSLINSIYLLLISIVILSCGDDKPINKQSIKNENTTVKSTIHRPDFNSDSAYFFIQQQVDFGPRFPNNKAHTDCAEYLKNKLQSYGFETQIQKGKAKTFNNKEITIKNIIGEFKPEIEKRILLFAHWDTRPFADQDKEKLTEPILGANDGGSGVGVLLEVARQISILNPKIGVDIIFFDAEDYGQPSSAMSLMDSDSWCLGSQFWAKNPHKPNYKAQYGILLDMVGTENAIFTKESISMQYAPDVVNKVWNIASSLGYSNYFTNELTYFVGVDDHKFVNTIANIPSIDIINYDRNTGNFHHSWHTHKDDMKIINKATLSVVGEVLLTLLYSEN